jgi:PIN domain nuclease of toxin-antitoxin system
MTVLLDTVTFLWLGEGAGKLSAAARQTIVAAENRLFLSSISAWEIHLKYSLGKLPLPESPALYIRRLRAARDIDALPFSEDDAVGLSALPPLHRDPFDRALVSQANARRFAVLTPDPEIRAYPVTTIW